MRILLKNTGSDEPGSSKVILYEAIQVSVFRHTIDFGERDLLYENLWYVMAHRAHIERDIFPYSHIKIAVFENEDSATDYIFDIAKKDLIEIDYKELMDRIDELNKKLEAVMGSCDHELIEATMVGFGDTYVCDKCKL